MSRCVLSPSEGAEGRCYCGAHAVIADAPPLKVIHCHCQDCRRVTGGAIATFAAFSTSALKIEPPVEPVSHAPGVTRRFCPWCGSALTAEFDYLPGQVYVPVGVLDDADAFVPELHCHADKMLNWVLLGDDLPRESGSGRNVLNEATE